MNREQHLKQANDALAQAEKLAGWAENAARGDGPHKAAPYAAAGTLWDSIARTHLLIAQATTADDTTPEA
ncbi:hypothetical protein [Streptomyces sp. NBC_00151]|uniref:hypothetical protein n=1 Tax=Streptomyces sp. NBC_00151 TaxID=2975669 RepID=UPI002DD80B59|nr:hypothetical protein [Streptomyces sp. NBC_00151]WRZ41888.1 hypothetical protein OG915_29915 [Streptomyces sp. NBC_00151]